MKDLTDIMLHNVFLACTSLVAGNKRVKRVFFAEKTAEILSLFTTRDWKLYILSEFCR